MIFINNYFILDIHTLYIKSSNNLGSQNMIRTVAFAALASVILAVAILR